MVRSPETPAEVERWFRKRLAELWPVATGCLSLRRSPCVRPNCQACATGEQHASYVLYGRRLQALMSEAGRRYTEARKHERRRRR